MPNIAPKQLQQVGATSGQVIGWSGTAWAPQTGAGTLDTAYDFGGTGAGRTINADNGAVHIDKGTVDANNAFEVAVTAGSGAGASISMGSSTTGIALTITSQSSANGLVVNYTGGGRPIASLQTGNTSSAVLFSSTGLTHNPVVEIDRTPASSDSGHGLFVIMGQHTTDDGINIRMVNGATGFAWSVYNTFLATNVITASPNGQLVFNNGSGQSTTVQYGAVASTTGVELDANGGPGSNINFNITDASNQLRVNIASTTYIRASATKLSLENIPLSFADGTSDPTIYGPHNGPDQAQLGLLGDVAVLFSGSHFAALDVGGSSLRWNGTSLFGSSTWYIGYPATEGPSEIFLGSSIAQVMIEQGAGSPNGSAVGNIGSIYLRNDGSTGTSFYVKESGTGNTGWTAIGAATAPALQTAYAGGNTIAATAARAIAFSNAVDTTNLLTLTRSFAGAGTALSASMGATTTGDALAVSLTNGATGGGLRITGGTSANTAIVVTQNSGNGCIQVVDAGNGGGYFYSGNNTSVSANIGGGSNAGVNVSMGGTASGVGLLVNAGTTTTGAGVSVVMVAGASGDGLDISNSGGGNGIFITQTGPTGQALAITHSSNNNAFSISSSSATLGGSQVVFIQNSGANDADVLYLDHNPSGSHGGNGLFINKASTTTGNGATINMAAGATGVGLSISMPTGAGTGNGISVTTDGANGVGIVVTTTNAGIALAATTSSAGSGAPLSISNNSNSGSAQTASIINAGTNDAGALDIEKVPGSTKAGAGITVFMGANTTGIGVGITMATGASGSALSLAGGSVTTNAPLLSGTQTWNAGGTTFTAFKLNVTNTASAAGSLLLDLQVGASSKFSVQKDGTISAFAGTFNGGDVVLNGTGTALTTGATSGFTFLPTMTAGSPSGTPAAHTGATASVWDTTNTKLWFYSSGSWVQPTLPTTTVTAYTSTPTTLTSLQNNTLSTNTGTSIDIAFTLPSITVGFEYRFAVTAAFYLRINAAGGATINLGSLVSATNGFVRSNVVGSMVRLVAVSSTQWFAEVITGTWTVDT